MAIRQDDSVEIILPSIEQFKNRTEIRRYILNQWMIEEPHNKYRYFVEALDNGSRIYLERPGRLNKGCDFVIYIEDVLLHGNGNDKFPKHDFAIDDSKEKKKGYTDEQWKSFLQAVEVIYHCGLYDDAFHLTKTLPNIGLSYELLLKLLRWFFIEQDVTYWARSGREMIYNKIINA